MDKKEALKQLRKLNKDTDKESAHGKADDILIELIDDEDIKKAYNKLEKWYG